MTVSLPRGLGGVMGSSNSGSVGSGIQNMLNNLASFVRNFPGECHRHVIVVTFILRNKHHTNIQIELQELEGGVKATGLFCLLGIGIGLGSLFIYKLYTRLFPKILLPPPPPHLPGKIRRPNSGELSCQKLSSAGKATCATDKTLAETPDSGISSNAAVAETADSNVANASSPNPETFCVDVRQGRDPEQLLRRRNTVAEWLAHAELTRNSDFLWETDFGSDLYNNQRDVLKSSWRSSGYISVDPAGGEGDGVGQGQRKRLLNEQNLACFTLEEDVMDDDVLSIADHILVPSVLSENAEDELLDQDADDLRLDPHQENAAGKASSLIFHCRKLSAGSCFSADVPHLWLRRNHHSFSSDVSATSGCTYRESLVSKGFSIDLGEDLTGILTPPDGDTAGLDHWTMSSMDQLHKELRKIQEDIDYMNEKVEVLLSKEDAVKLPAALSADEDNRKMMRGAKRRHRSKSLSPTRSRSCSVDRDIEDEFDVPDFIWDYHSDLALDKYDKPTFVVKRPHHVFKDSIGDQPMESLDAEAALRCTVGHEACQTKRPESAGLNQMRRDKYVEAYFGDKVGMGCRDFGSCSTNHSGAPCSSPHSREEMQKSSAHDVDHFLCPHQSRICDLPSSMPGFCFSNTLCGGGGGGGGGGHIGHSHISSDVCFLCHEKMVVLHPHLSCPSCHDLRRGRPLSARTSRKSERSSLSSQCDVCCSALNPNCNCFQPVVHHCVNSPVMHCQSCFGTENRKGSKQSSDLNSDRCPMRSQSHVSKIVVRELANSTRTNIIGNKINIRDYQTQELVRCESSVETKKGYDLLNRLWGVSSIRKVHCDNYGNLRAVLFQALKHKLPILAASGTFQYHVQLLAMAIDSGNSYLTNWRFGNQCGLTREEVVMKMTECLRALFEQVEAVADMSGVTCREQYLLALINHSPEMDLALLEGLKILMMLKAIHLFNEYNAQRKDTPTFVLQLFAKESSKSLESFFNNHINVIGNTAPMKAVEMCLLGLTLDVRIEVIRPSQFNKEGFVVHYPDEGADSFDKVHIIEEDCNRYCIPVMK